MSNFQFPHQTAFYKGKVRNVYTIKDTWLVMVASNRISAFDVVLPKPIPYKGQVLNQIAAHMLEATASICPNWLLSTPCPHVAIGKKCEPFKIEMVVRGYLTGHAWRTYKQGIRVLCGVPLPDGMKENDPFPKPIITPTTKAAVGHDEDISQQAIIEQGIVSAADYAQLAQYALQLFARGQALAAQQGLLLVDTKYEFGKINDTIYLMDEIHTPDSSRYFYAEGFEERQQQGLPQQQLSKEFVREWLIANNFMGKKDQTIPPMTEEWIQTISEKYISLYEKLLGKKFIPQPLTDEETYQQITTALEACYAKN